MPLFHDPERRRHYRSSDGHGEPVPQATGSSRHRSGENSHTGLDGPELTSISTDLPCSELYPTKSWVNDRLELIQRIKESSPWRLQYTTHEDSNQEVSMFGNSPVESHVGNTGEGPPSEDRNYIHPSEELDSPADIRRPRSALHSGDFREGAEGPPNPGQQSPQPHFTEQCPLSPFPRLGTSPTTPWFGASAFQTQSRRFGFSDRHEPITLETRSRAPSLGSFSSSYVLKAPTSPLVHQANNTDLDFSPRVETDEPLELLERANRRRTLPPETFRHLQPSPPSLRAVNIRNPFQSGGQDALCHQQDLPRRSLTSAYSLQLAPAGNAQAYRSRRPSFASEFSTKPHAPMVGSYEESILRGRMSMSPSKPLDFTAQIGVLGKGKCKGHLRCPPHVTVPFPAVFYSYPTSGTGRSIADDSPSPYVGQIDLENSLPKDESNTTRRRRRHRSPSKIQEGIVPGEAGASRFNETETLRRREKKNRRSESPKCPPGGCYRIPQQGQLQIIIKNPHKTAVKLFLVPYDLTDMEPGTKTFIRQRSYSAGPIIDMPLDARKNFGTDRPEASLNASEDPRDKPVLRYLIHLNICCTARGRFYLHSSIRVVFANRVPDDKEKLRNEIQLPEPRYSPYKPTRDSTTSGSASARLAVEKASRRRSVGQGAIPHLRQHVSSPSDVPLHWTAAEAMGFAPHLPISDKNDSTIYHKLNKGDAGYGGYPYPSINRGPDNGESLLAKRLRGLDVHKQELFDGN